MKKCYLFTHNYPFGHKGIFVEQEIGKLSKQFDKVVVLPLHKEADVLSLPENVEILYLFDGFEKKYHTISTFTKARWFFQKELWRELMLHGFKKNARTYILSHYFRARFMAILVRKHLEPADLTQSFCYSFWFDQWVTVLALLKKNYIPGLQFVSRAHGFEIFSEQGRHGYHLFRSLQLQEVSKVFSVSGFGRQRLVYDNPRFESKIYALPLGSDDHGTNPFEPDAVFTIFSCARILKLKRLDKIIEALKYLGMPVRWVHFGGFTEGQEETGIQFCNDLEELLKWPDIQVVHIRDFNQKQIMEYYAANHANVFVSASESEGMPVSILEAISFGIPVIATDVGGCKEVVTEETGILIPADALPRDIAQAIRAFKKSHRNTPEFRQGVREYWQQHWKRDVVLQEFMNLATAS